MIRPITIALVLGLAACSGGPRRPAPKPVSAPKSLGNAAVNQGTIQLPGAHPAGEPLYVTHAGAWPDIAPRPPVVAVLAPDESGAHWILHRRHAARVQGGEVTSAPHPGTYRRGALARGRLADSTFQGQLPKGTLDTDRFVFIASGSGPVSQRIAGRMTLDGTTRQITTRGGQGPLEVLAVRVGSISPDVRTAPLGVTVDAGCPSTTSNTLLERLKALDAGAFLAGGNEVQVRCQGERFHVKSNRRLLRTPFWAPHDLKVGSVEEVTAILAGAHGAQDSALYALDSVDTPVLRAALALEAGWLTDVPALLAGNDQPASALLSAGALYLMGDSAGARSALDQGSWEGATGQLAWRPHLARALLQMESGDLRSAITALEAAIDAETDASSRRSLLLGLAEIHLAGGDLPRFARTLQHRDLGGTLPPSQAALRDRYAGLVLQAQGKPDAALAAYLEAANAYSEGGQRRLAAQTLLVAAQRKVASGRDASDELSLARQLAIDGHDDDMLGHVALAAFTTYAEVHAAAEAPADAQSMGERAVTANLRADRLDRVAKARRYGLLLLPAGADLSAKRKTVSAALADAMAAPDMEEITILLSLRAQLKAAGFAFDEAAQDMDLAIGFAMAANDPDLAAMLQEEKKALQ